MRREKLPWCSLPLLTTSTNQGHWKGDQWEPARCRTRELEPAEILECLRGKSLLMVGDSQIRYIAAELMALLAARSRTSYTHKWKSNLKVQGTTFTGGEVMEVKWASLSHESLVGGPRQPLHSAKSILCHSGRRICAAKT